MTRRPRWPYLSTAQMARVWRIRQRGRLMRLARWLEICWLRLAWYGLLPALVGGSLTWLALAHPQALIAWGMFWVVMGLALLGWLRHWW